MNWTLTGSILQDRLMKTGVRFSVINSRSWVSQVLANLYPGQRAAQNCCLSNMLWTLKKPCCQVLDEVNSATLFSHNHLNLWEIPSFLTQPRTPGSFVLLLPQLSSGPFLQRTMVLSLKCGLEAKLCALDVPTVRSVTATRLLSEQN